MSLAHAARAYPRTNSPEAEAAYAAASPRLVAEILEGVVMMSPRPAPRHGRLATRLLVRLAQQFDAGDNPHGEWLFIPEPELHLGEAPDKMQPDLAGWHTERLPSDPGEAAITVAPDWVCEILSPSTEALDRGVKMPLYARHGVRHAWLTDPTERYLEAFRLDAGRFRQIVSLRDEAVARVEPFERLELAFGSLWAWARSG